MTRTRDITAALRSLDAADGDFDPAQQARADLRHILASDPVQTSAPSSGHRARRTRRRFALAGGMVAAVTAAAVTLPSLAGGDKAFATWTRVPGGMTAHERAEAGDDCRARQEGGAGAEYAEDLRTAEPVIAERRGVWTTVVLAGPGGFSALCITDDSAHLFSKGMIGSLGPSASYTAPEPRDVVATDLGSGAVGSRELSLAAGTAGSDVAGIAFRSRDHGRVAATVSNGRFALWLPGDEFQDAAGDGVEFEVTYRDGSTDTIVLTL